jgi:hypothetical protein
LSLGLPSQSKYTKSASFNSSSSSAESKTFYDIWRPAAEPSTAAQAMCLRWQSGFQEGSVV